MAYNLIECNREQMFLAADVTLEENDIHQLHPMPSRTGVLAARTVTEQAQQELKANWNGRGDKEGVGRFSLWALI